MAGIAQASVYVGPVELPGDVVAGLDGRGPRRVAAGDEDALTMSLAALDAAGSPGGARERDHGPAPDLLLTCVPGAGLGARGLVATAAAAGAAACQVPSVGLAWEPGAAASLLRTAGDLRPERGVVLAVDCGETQEGTAAPVGDLAVALRLGEPEIADIVGSAWAADLTFDHWKDESGRLHVADTRFVEHALVSGSGKRLLDELRKAGDAATDEPVSVVALTPGGRPAPRVVRALSGGAAAADVPAWAGAPGRMVAGALYLLLHQLAAVEPGTLVALLDLAYGGEAVLLRAGPRAREAVEALQPPAPGERDLPWYLRTRGLLPSPRPEPMIAPPELWRELGELLALRGRHCASCDLTMYPSTHVCEGCGSSDGEMVPLRRTGTVLTETVDRLFPSGGGAAVQMVAVELDGGGRFYGQAVEEAAPLAVGDRCRLVVRRVHRGGGLPHYFWKVMPDGR